MASMWPPKKNTAFTLGFTLYTSDGSVIANPGTYTKKISIDGGSVADIAASVTEENTTYGQLSVVLSSSEMNGDWIWVQIQDDTPDCVPFTVVIYTVPETGQPVDVWKWLGNDAQTPLADTDIRDIVWAKAMTELATVPAVTSTVLAALSWCFTALRNNQTRTNTLATLFKDDDATTLATADITTGATQARGKWTPPT